MTILLIHSISLLSLISQFENTFKAFKFYATIIHFDEMHKNE